MRVVSVSSERWWRLLCLILQTVWSWCSSLFIHITSATETFYIKDFGWKSWKSESVGKEGFRNSERDYAWKETRNCSLTTKYVFHLASCLHCQLGSTAHHDFTSKLFGTVQIWIKIWTPSWSNFGQNGHLTFSYPQCHRKDLGSTMRFAHAQFQMLNTFYVWNLSLVWVNLKKILTVASATFDLFWPCRSFPLCDPTQVSFWQPEDWLCSQVGIAPMAELGHLQVKRVCWREGILKEVLSRV